MFGAGRTAARAAAALAVVAAVMAGAGVVPLKAASALPVNPVGGRTSGTSTASAPEAAETGDAVLAPAGAESKTTDLREPSGLEAADARTAGQRTPTAVTKSGRILAYKEYLASLKTQPVGIGPWKSAKVSWYGPGFYGNTMAGGGTLQPTSMVVAHRSLPFGTKIQFTYNGKTCVAVVRDRGPYVGDRVFDLGPGTAKALGFSGVGTVQYRFVK
jgi:rare lipoprotein A